MRRDQVCSAITKDVHLGEASFTICSFMLPMHSLQLRDDHRALARRRNRKGSAIWLTWRSRLRLVANAYLIPRRPVDVEREETFAVRHIYMHFRFRSPRYPCYRPWGGSAKEKRGDKAHLREPSVCGQLFLCFSGKSTPSGRSVLHG